MFPFSKNLITTSLATAWSSFEWTVEQWTLAQWSGTLDTIGHHWSGHIIQCTVEHWTVWSLEQLRSCTSCFPLGTSQFEWEKPLSLQMSKNTKYKTNITIWGGKAVVQGGSIVPTPTAKFISSSFWVQVQLSSSSHLTFWWHRKIIQRWTNSFKKKPFPALCCVFTSAQVQVHKSTSAAN